MHKIEGSTAAAGGLFTNGDPATGTPATIVQDNWLNAVQTELVNFITSMGLTLGTAGSDSMDQLKTALAELFSRGGSFTSSSPSQSIANNQSSAADVTCVPNFDKTVVATIEFLFKIVRTSSGGTLIQRGRAYIDYDPVNNAWLDPVIDYTGDDAGVTFSVAAVSGNAFKLQYISDNKGGTSYSGTLRVTDIKQIRL